MSDTTGNPTAAEERQAKRERVLAYHIERGRRDGLRSNRSIKCGDYGQHAGVDGGCRSDGEFCICECHDPARPS